MLDLLTLIEVVRCLYSYSDLPSECCYSETSNETLDQPPKKFEIYYPILVNSENCQARLFNAAGV